jgi:hypothetical protein
MISAMVAFGTNLHTKGLGVPISNADKQRLLSLDDVVGFSADALLTSWR